MRENRVAKNIFQRANVVDTHNRGQILKLLFTLLLPFHLFLHKGITAGSHHFAPKCRPVITLEGIVVSSVENKTMEKSLLGHYTNISSCELDCCQKRNCDLVLFDGKLCYGAFCTPDNTCHFQSAKGEQISYRAVFMNNIFKGKRCVKLSVRRLTATGFISELSCSIDELMN